MTRASGRCAEGDGPGGGSSRRRFLTVAAGLLALPGCASLASVTIPAAAGVLRLLPDDHPGLDEPGGVLRVRPERWDLSIYLLRDDAGGFTALSPVCTHLGCVVEIEGSVLACPCHGSTYARSGDVLRGPAERALRRFPTTVEPDGTVVIDVRGGER